MSCYCNRFIIGHPTLTMFEKYCDTLVFQFFSGWVWTCAAAKATSPKRQHQRPQSRGQPQCNECGWECSQKLFLLRVFFPFCSSGLFSCPQLFFPTTWNSCFFALRPPLLLVLLLPCCAPSIDLTPHITQRLITHRSSHRWTTKIKV